MKTALLLLRIAICSVPFLFSACRPGAATEEPKNDKGAFQDSIRADSVSTYLDMGRQFVTATQGVLAKNLIEAINNDGPAFALGFCNERAYPLTDSLTQTLNAGIRRVTDKPRNPANKADSTVMARIRQMQSALEKGELPTAIVSTQDGKMIGYYPIFTNAMCLQCHGIPITDIANGTMDRIHALYPDDLATGYGVNELRGVWVVEMAKQ